jgi:3-hydroxybutyryl-CoA dehydrogenase
MPDKIRVCILGESTLVAEYSKLCNERGLAVSVRPNTRRHALRLPRGVRHMGKPTKAVEFALELTNCDAVNKRKNLVELDRVLPPKVPIVVSSVTVTLREMCGWVNRPQRLVGLGAFPTLLDGSLVELVRNDITGDAPARDVEAFVAMLGKESTFVQDTPGMVLPRIIAALANEACFALMERVATAEDIDIAMKLGTNYPRGPVEWMNAIGVDQVYAVMVALHRYFGEDRYRPAPFLLRTVQL